MRMPSRRQLAVLVGALVLTVAATLALPHAAKSDDGFATDGYLKWDDNDCLVMRDHDGKTRVLTGAVDGLDADDHVRLWGRTVRNAECRDRSGQAYEVTEVLTIWANDRHTETYYDHETDGSFARWVQKNRPD